MPPGEGPEGSSRGGASPRRPETRRARRIARRTPGRQTRPHAQRRGREARGARPGRCGRRAGGLAGHRAIRSSILARPGPGPRRGPRARGAAAAFAAGAARRPQAAARRAGPARGPGASPGARAARVASPAQVDDVLAVPQARAPPRALRSGHAAVRGRLPEPRVGAGRRGGAGAGGRRGERGVGVGSAGPARGGRAGPRRSERLHRHLDRVSGLVGTSNTAFGRENDGELVARWSRKGRSPASYKASSTDTKQTHVVCATTYPRRP